MTAIVIGASRHKLWVKVIVETFLRQARGPGLEFVQNYLPLVLRLVIYQYGSLQPGDTRHRPENGSYLYFKDLGRDNSE